MGASESIRQEANAAVRKVIEAQIAAGKEIGVQVVAYLDGKLVIDTWAGLADPASGRKVDGDTLFSVYSVTKAVAAVACHMLVDRGLLDYDTPIVKWWPEYGAHGKEKTTLRHILTHRAGVPQMPKGVTPERMCDWNWMTREIAALTPLAEPGSKTLYQSMTFGWLCGELVCRADPKKRPFGQFVREEIAEPLKAPDLWVGLPDEAAPRMARHVEANFHVNPKWSTAIWRTMSGLSKVLPEQWFAKMLKLPPLFLASMPFPVALVPAVFERPDVRRASIGGVGGVFSARSCARFWAMLAQGGELDGVRLLSSERVASFNTPRAHAEEADPVMFGFPMPISIGGFWLGGMFPPIAAAISPKAIFHPGAGNSVGWADFDKKLAVAICHNRMFSTQSPDQDTVLPIAQAVNKALGITP